MMVQQSKRGGQKTRERQCVMDYKEKILELLDKIDTNTAAPSGIVSGNTFLKRIYISLLEYVGEVESVTDIGESEKRKRMYLKKIFEMLNKVDDLWVLNLAYEIIEKLTRKEG